MKTPLLPILILAVICGCQPAQENPPTTTTKPTPTGITVSSPDIGADRVIADKFSKDGGNVSPEIKLTGLPKDTKGIALIVDDPDAPGPAPFLHWIAVFTGDNLPQGVSTKPFPGLAEGKNGAGVVGYFGPKPPSGVHHYHFRVYALDMVLPFGNGFTREALESALKGHVLAEAELVGTYAAK